MGKGEHTGQEWIRWANWIIRGVETLMADVSELFKLLTQYQRDTDKALSELKQDIANLQSAASDRNAQQDLDLSNSRREVDKAIAANSLKLAKLEEITSNHTWIIRLVIGTAIAGLITGVLALVFTLGKPKPVATPPPAQTPAQTTKTR
jgi:hypothetical protein